MTRMEEPAGQVPLTRDCVTAVSTLSVTLPLVPPPLSPAPAATPVMSPVPAVVCVVPSANRMPPALTPSAGPPVEFSK